MARPLLLALALLLPWWCPSRLPRRRPVTLYEHVGFAGRSATITAATAALEGAWNDQASSVKISGGTWELCRHDDYTDCRQLAQDIADLRSIGFNDVLSSLRPVGLVGSVGTAANAPARDGASTGAAVAGATAQVRGYLEYRKGDALIVEGQRLVTTPSTRFHGSGEARSPRPSRWATWSRRPASAAPTAPSRSRASTPSPTGNRCSRATSSRQPTSSRPPGAPAASC